MSWTLDDLDISEFTTVGVSATICHSCYSIHLCFGPNSQGQVGLCTAIVDDHVCGAVTQTVADRNWQTMLSILEELSKGPYQTTMDKFA